MLLPGETAVTFGRAMTLALIVVTGIYRAFGWTASCFGLVVVQLIVFVGTTVPFDPTARILFVAVVNGLFLFLSAAGAEEAAVDTKAFKLRSASLEGRSQFLKSSFIR